MVTEYTPQELAAFFAHAADVHFGGIQREHGLTRSLETLVYEVDGYREASLEDIDGHFFSMRLTLSGPLVEIAIEYGDREHYMNCLIRPAYASHPFALWEWMQALDDDGLEDSGDWVLTTSRIDSLLSMYEASLERTLARIVRDGEGLIPEIEAERLRRRDEERIQMAEAEHRRLASRAAAAFRDKDFPGVVEALSAVNVPLTPSEQRHLDYARERLEA